MAGFAIANMIKSWEKSGKTEFIRHCKNLVGMQKFLVEAIAEDDLKRALHSLCWYAVRGSLKIEHVATVLAEVVEMHLDVPSLLADVFSIMDVETLCSEENDQREKFMTLVPACISLVPECILKERLDQDTLENMGLVQSKFAFQQKYVKMKTKLFYKQQKFNLLREESEGYSKLVTELNQDRMAGVQHQAVLENIKSLIGCFNLDPNRVLDIILESFECRPELTEFFVPLLRAYTSDPDTLCHVLGFKFHFYQLTQDSETPASLYGVAALLLVHQLIDLDTLYPHLGPSDSDIIEKHKRDVLEAKAYARKVNTVVLGDKPENKDKEEKETKVDQNENNQKLGLCQALIHIGDWDHAKKVMDRLPPFFVTSHRPVAETICLLVNRLIEPLYQQHSGLPSVLLKRRAKLNLPAEVCITAAQTFPDLLKVIFPLLQYLGPSLAYDPVLLVKLVRLAKNFMKKRDEERKEEGMISDVTDSVFRGFLTMVDEAVFPSLSLIPTNCCLTEEVWGFIRLLKYEYRYRLYGQWKNDSHVIHPKLIRAKADVIDRAKYIMKRLAKENIKPLGRQIGKCSHSNPGVLFEYILSQIQRYDNFIGPVVDSLKFLTNLSYDVLAYCIIEALANPERERLKTDDTNISLWLQSLANFSGAVFKKYQIELGGLLQYVVNQLKAGKCYDLLILREVVQRMAGIEVSEEITDDQLQAMGGGELLRQEGGYFAQVRNTKKSSSRLKEALLDYSLCIPLCLLMAQQRDQIVFTKDTHDKRHLKLIGRLYDQCQDTFVQFISFLSLQLGADDLTKRLPQIDQLLSVYHCSPEVAFALWRGVYCNNVLAKYDEFRKSDKKEKQGSSQSARQKRYFEASEIVMKCVMDNVQPSLPQKTWDDFSLQFYCTFWTLTLCDLQVPSAAYDRQVQQLKGQVAGIEDNKDLAQNKKKKEKERCVGLMDKLQEEERKQQDHVKLVMARLKKEKDNWFVSKSMKQAIVTCVLQMCVFPRCCFTASDSLYCAKLLYIMHNLKTPNFSSLICYDRILSDITMAMTSCTENEAHRYGRFLCAVFDDIMRWHSDKAIFEKECGHHPGFVTVLKSSGSGSQQLDYETFRHVVHKWHLGLSRVFVKCMESGAFIQIRNALIVMTKILPHYPRVQKFGQALERRVDRVSQEEKEKRPDIYALAMGYSGQLKMRRKTWVPESEFHNPHKNNPDANKTAAKSSTPAPAPVKQEVALPQKDKKVAIKEEKTDRDSRERHKEANDKDKPVESKDTKEKKPETKTSVKVEYKNGKENKPESRTSDKERDRKEYSKEKDRISDNEAIKKEDSGREREKKERKEDKGLKEKDDKPPSKEDKGRERDKVEKGKDRGHREERDKQKENKRESKDGDRGREKERVKAESKGHSKESRGHSRSEVEKDRGDYLVDKGSSSGSSSGHGGQRRSAEPSPRHVDDRDIKRRKLETSTAAKDVYHSPHQHQHSSHHSESRDKAMKSPRENERTEWDVDRGKGREWEKREVKIERKRERTREEEADMKRHRMEEPGRGLNGDTERSRRSRTKEDKERARIREEPSINNHVSSSKTTTKKDSPDRRSDKRTSKKSKRR